MGERQARPHPTGNQWCSAVWMITQQFICGVLHRGQQRPIPRKVSDAKLRRTALPCAKQFAGASEFEILLRDRKPVCGLSQCGEALLGHVAERGLIHQQADRLAGTATDPSAQLVQL